MFNYDESFLMSGELYSAKVSKIGVDGLTSQCYCCR